MTTFDTLLEQREKCYAERERIQTQLTASQDEVKRLRGVLEELLSPLRRYAEYDDGEINRIRCNYCGETVVIKNLFQKNSICHKDYCPVARGKSELEEKT